MQLLRSQLTPSDDGVKLSHKSGEPELGLANIFVENIPYLRGGAASTQQNVASLHSCYKPPPSSARSNERRVLGAGR